MPSITIYLPDDLSQKLTQVAELDNRSISNTVATILKSDRRFQVLDVTHLPHPADATPVPLVTVQARA